VRRCAGAGLAGLLACTSLVHPSPSKGCGSEVRGVGLHVATLIDIDSIVGRHAAYTGTGSHAYWVVLTTSGCLLAAARASRRSAAQDALSFRPESVVDSDNYLWPPGARDVNSSYLVRSAGVLAHCCHAILRDVVGVVRPRIPDLFVPISHHGHGRTVGTIDSNRHNHPPPPRHTRTHVLLGHTIHARYRRPAGGQGYVVHELD
jgi:hypothetical protein